MRGVRRARRGEGREGARLVDADVDDLALGALFVGQEELAVDRGVVLTLGVVDLRRREVRVHTERARLVGDDRDDAVAEALDPQQVLEQTDERHGRRDLLRARTLLGQRVGLVAGQLETDVGRATLGQEAAERTTTLEHVLDRLVVLAGVVVRRLVGVLLQLRVRDRDVHRVAEGLEVVQRQLLHLVGRVAALEVRTEAVALDGLGEDDGRLALVLLGRLECREHLAVVVATALEAPDLLVGIVLDELEGAGVASEEVLANVRAVLGLVCLIVTVRGAVHEVEQRALGVAGEQVVPLAAPDDLDDVPAGTAEEALELLNDLAVAAHRAVEALEVAVDDERQVVQALVGRDLELSAALDLVHLAVAEVGPDVRVGDVLDAAVAEVLVRHRLVDGVDRTETHRHRRELPELRHEARVRVRREAVRRGGLLLAEAVELRLGEATLEVSARVRAGGGVALDEDLVAAGRVVETAEKVVEADLVQSGRRRVRRDVTADADTGPLRTVHRDRGVPADPLAVPALELLVTRELGLVGLRDGVDVVGGRHHRNTEVQILRALEQAQHDLAPACGALRLDQLTQGFLPFRGLFRVAVLRPLRIRILVVNSHGRPFVVWQVMPENRHTCAATLVCSAQFTIVQPTQSGPRRMPTSARARRNEHGCLGVEASTPFVPRHDGWKGPRV
ncbi:hypothetical protein SRABI128_02023 [Microbacterium sp. Bi128]|nr:hypothetical protein SRABI128_02023 [Microbacterium sp. Bi128]